MTNDSTDKSPGEAPQDDKTQADKPEAGKNQVPATVPDPGQPGLGQAQPAEPRKTARGFQATYLSDIDGKKPKTLRDVWNWHYAIVEPVTDPKDVVLAEAISRAAAMVREFHKGGRPQEAAVAKAERAASIDVMEQLVNLFVAVVIQGQQVEHDWAMQSVAASRAEFIRRVIEPRHRRNLARPVSTAFVWMLILSVLAFATLAVPPEVGKSLKPALDNVFPDGTKYRALPGTLLVLIGGVFMGRLLFFATAFSEKLKSIEDYLSFQRFTGESASLSLTFDVVTGLAAFLLFQTNIIVLSVGGGGAAAEGGNQGGALLSTQNIDDNWLLAFAFGALIGISRAAFLGRIGDVSKKTVTGSGA